MIMCLRSVYNGLQAGDILIFDRRSYIMKRRVFKILKITAPAIAAVTVVFFAVRAVGIGINRRVPEGGINESMYVDINGTKQWINIYGGDL